MHTLDTLRVALTSLYQPPPVLTGRGFIAAAPRAFELAAMLSERGFGQFSTCFRARPGQSDLVACSWDGLEEELGE